MYFGARLEKSLAGPTTLAATFVVKVAIKIVITENITIRGLSNF
jgi:hypothetical protein